VGERGHVYVFDPLPRRAIMRQQLEMNPPLAPRYRSFRWVWPINDVAPPATTASSIRAHDFDGTDGHHRPGNCPNKVPHAEFHQDGYQGSA
jgi:hypothetical protein